MVGFKNFKNIEKLLVNYFVRYECVLNVCEKYFFFYDDMVVGKLLIILNVIEVKKEINVFFGIYIDCIK